MEYIYSALLLHSVGKPVTEDSVASVLKAAGTKSDPARVKALTASLEGVNIEEAIKSAAIAAPAPAAAAPAAGGSEKKEDKKKDEAPAVSEEQAAEGLGALFG